MYEALEKKEKIENEELNKMKDLKIQFEKIQKQMKGNEAHVKQLEKENQKLKLQNKRLNKKVKTMQRLARQKTRQQGKHYPARPPRAQHPTYARNHKGPSPKPINPPKELAIKDRSNLAKSL